jgi:hypothetical protein
MRGYADVSVNLQTYPKLSGEKGGDTSDQRHLPEGFLESKGKCACSGEKGGGTTPSIAPRIDTNSLLGLPVW